MLSMTKVVPADLPMTNLGSTGSNQGRQSSHGSNRGSGASYHDAPRGSIVLLARHGVRKMFYRSGWYDSAVAVSTRKFIRGRFFAIVTLVALFVALFFSEIFAIVQVSTNTLLNIILTIVLAIFAFEFVGLTLTDASYMLGFFFWMDMLGTVSLFFDISFLGGPDATRSEEVTQGGSTGRSDNMIVVRAARAAKLGARAGRISRVVKVLRFLPFLLDTEQDAGRCKTAKVITTQLVNVLSTRVAFLTICVVIVLPLFTLFTYPETDESMTAWTKLLARDADRFHDAWSRGDASLRAEEQSLLLSELRRFFDFFRDVAYGPYRVEYGDLADGVFASRSDVLDLSGAFVARFTEPQRPSSSRIVTIEHIRASFDLSQPAQNEAAANVGLIIFILVVMLSFGLVTSSSISVIALQPLERMLTVVRARCQQIFKYTNELQDDAAEDEEEEEAEEYDDMEHASEFVLLEQVVGKLADIVQVLTTKQELVVKDDMDDDDKLKLNWMQGANATVANSTVEKVRQSILSNASQTARSSLLELLAPGEVLRKSGGVELVTHSEEAEEDSLHSTSLTFDHIQGVDQATLDALDMPHFSPLDLTKEAKLSIASYMLSAWEGNSAWVSLHVRESSIPKFVAACESWYFANPFHNFAHAVDVEYMVLRFMQLIEADRFLSEVQQFWLLLAAVAHDVGHPGVNNQYLVETSHELAVRYNDRSPLENMHCTTLFQLTSTEAEANVFSQFSKDLYKEVRNGIIDAVLHTDVTKHSEMIKDMCVLYQMNQEAFDNLEPGGVVLESHKNVTLVLNLLLHGADVGNPMKPWDLCKRYAYLCLDEFFAQGDLEKAAGVPVQMLNDREKVNGPNCQVGFIEFVICPMMTAMVNMFPQLESLAEFLGQNIVLWSEVWQEESVPTAEAAAKVSARVQKVAAACKGLTRGGDGLAAT